MRVGYGLCGSPELVSAFNQMRQPFFCNAAAQAAAIEALKHQDPVAQRVERAIFARIDATTAVGLIDRELADLSEQPA